MVLIRQERLDKFYKGHRFLSLNFQFQGGRMPVSPALLKCTSFLTIVARGLFQTPITYGIIQSISFPFEIQLESTHEVYYSWVIFSYFWELLSICPDRYLAPSYYKKNIKKFKRKASLILHLCESKHPHLDVTAEVPTPKQPEEQGSF